MSVRMDARSKHRALNTLTCLVMGLVGRQTTIELHNDSYVIGTIVNADSKMNVELRHARLIDGNGNSLRLDNFHVMGRRIRYVHIPEDVDVLQVLKKQVDGVAGPERGRGRGRGQSVRQKIALKREQQTLHRHQMQHQAD